MNEFKATDEWYKNAAESETGIPEISAGGHTKELCHCGMPLHYTDKVVEEIMHKIVKAKGSRFVKIECIETGKKYNVDVHYAALHGVEGRLLDTYGFEVIDE